MLHFPHFFFLKPFKIGSSVPSKYAFFLSDAFIGVASKTSIQGKGLKWERVSFFACAVVLNITMNQPRHRSSSPGTTQRR